MDTVVSFLYSGSIEKRITASTMFAVNIGKRSDTVEMIKSYVPYFEVESTLVYNGTRRKPVFSKKNY